MRCSPFEQTFDFLNEILEENSFKKFNALKNKYIAVFSRMRGNKILERLTVKDSNTPHSCDYRYSGPILMSLFEIVAVGLGYRLLHGHELPDQKSFKEKHKSILSDIQLNRALNINNSGSGINSRTRIPNTVKYGRNWFKQWE